MPHKRVLIPHLGRTVVLVDRDRLRWRRHGRTFRVPAHLKGLRSAPTPPASWDWGQGLSYPILGNDQYGDCYYAAMCHGSQTWTGHSTGYEYQFDEQAVINRYLAISGGDNGLSDSDIEPEWKGGIVGPGGPRKVLDFLTIDPADANAHALACWAFGGNVYTAALPDAWVVNPQPGDVWDVAAPDQSNGHAMWQTGRDGSGRWVTQTWGFTPPIAVTQAGLAGSDPELLAVFSLDWFNAAGVAPNGMDYADLAALWVQCGGAALPPSPFGPPPPTPGPTPPPPPPVPCPVPLVTFTAQWPGVELVRGLTAGKRYGVVAL